MPGSSYLTSFLPSHLYLMGPALHGDSQWREHGAVFGDPVSPVGHTYFNVSCIHDLAQIVVFKGSRALFTHH